MKRTILVSMLSGLFGSALWLILLSATDIVGARSSDVIRSGVAHTNEVSATTPLTSTFTYQGLLKNSGVAVNGSCNMAFRLYDDPVAPDNLISTPITLTVPITNGLFTVGLNFFYGVFDGNSRWLDIRIRCPAGVGSYTTLTPRQELTPAPYALFSAAPWETTNNGITYIGNVANSVGIGTSSPSAGVKLEVNGATKVTPGGSGGFIQFHTPNAETGMSIIGTNRADVRFDGTTLKLVAGTGTGPPCCGLAIKTVGNVGIGTFSPDLARLQVRGPDTSGSTAAFRVENSNGDLGLQVYDDGTVGFGAFYGSAATHVCRNVFLFSACDSAAEYVPSIDSGVGFPEAADLVSIAPSVTNPYGDTHSPFVVQKSATRCDPNLLGFIVKPESGADGPKLNDYYLPLAIYGYFSAKVTLENGPIQRGDAITSSSKPGYGMKATQACKIIGYALEDADREGTIQVFANHGENAAPEVAMLRTQVQEMKQTVANLIQEKDAQMAAQEKQINSLQARLTALEQQASNVQNPAPNSQQMMLGLGALLMVGVVYHQRRASRGGQ